MSRLLITAGRPASAWRILIFGALLASAWVVFGAASAHALGLADSISETVEEATQAPVTAPATGSAPPLPSEVPGVQESAGTGLVSALTAPVSAVPLTTTVTDVVAPVTNTVADVVAPVTNTVTNTVTDVVAPVTNTVTDVVAPVTNTVTDVVAPVTNTVAPVINTVTDVVSSVSVTEPVDAGTAGVSGIISPAPVEVPAPQTLFGGGASTGVSAIAAVSPVQIFDPVFVAAPIPDTQNQIVIADESSVEGDSTSVSARSAVPVGPVPDAQAPVLSGSGSSGSGSVLRVGGDTGFAGVAILDSSQFSVELSGSDAVFARSAGIPGLVALEHGFSPD